MGTSTDAILAFGFDLGEELPESLLEPESEDGFDFEEWLVGRAGIERPDGGDWSNYFARRREVIAACPFDLITHCSYDYPMYFLAARGTEQKARRGYPEAIAVDDVDAGKVEAMRAFCAEFGIEWQEPRWQIFSLWG